MRTLGCEGIGQNVLGGINVVPTFYTGYVHGLANTPPLEHAWLLFNAPCVSSSGCWGVLQRH